MKIYDLDQSIDGLLKNRDYQIEIIGEDGGWTVSVNRRAWDEKLQRWDYSFEAGCTAETFLEVYDFIAGEIFKHTPPEDDTPPLVKFLSEPFVECD